MKLEMKWEKRKEKATTKGGQPFVECDQGGAAMQKPVASVGIHQGTGQRRIGDGKGQKWKGRGTTKEREKWKERGKGVKSGHGEPARRQTFSRSV
jgi:hypothetical protein